MPFPERIHAKISSEAAGYVSLTQVVTRELTVPELIRTIVSVTGKDAPRIQGILRQGSVVTGASRFRWAPIEASLQEIADLVHHFPDPIPDRPFDSSMCVRAALAGGRATIELPREAASRTGWFRRRSFWQALMETAAGLDLHYHHYSYADSADVYWAELPAEAARALREQAGLLRYSSLETQVRDYSYDRIELWIER